MGADANGDLWVGLWNAGKLMKIDHKTRQMTIYSPPSPTSGAYSVVVDKKRNFIWVSLQQVDRIARFDPKAPFCWLGLVMGRVAHPAKPRLIG